MASSPGCEQRAHKHNRQHRPTGLTPIDGGDDWNKSQKLFGLNGR